MAQTRTHSQHLCDLSALVVAADQCYAVRITDLQLSERTRVGGQTNQKKEKEKRREKRNKKTYDLESKQQQKSLDAKISAVNKVTQE
jgi:hypothetical protein